MQRENQGSTGMLDQIAIPHATSLKILKPAILILQNKQGIDNWETLDGSKVKTVICLCMPQEKASKHLDLLAYIAKKLANKEVRKKIVILQEEALIWKILN